MAIVIHDIDDEFVDRKGNRNLDIILKDDVTNGKKVIRWSGDVPIPDDDAAARAIVTNKIDWLWAHSTAKPYDEAPGNIVTKRKRRRQEIPNVANVISNINSATTVDDLKPIIRKLLRYVT